MDWIYVGFTRWIYYLFSSVCICVCGFIANSPSHQQLLPEVGKYMCFVRSGASVKRGEHHHGDQYMCWLVSLAF